jgi:hypothetical protein
MLATGQQVEALPEAGPNGPTFRPPIGKCDLAALERGHPASLAVLGDQIVLNDDPGQPPPELLGPLMHTLFLVDGALGVAVLVEIRKAQLREPRQTYGILGFALVRGHVSILGQNPAFGKTALAVQWAHRVRRRFPDGDLYVNLRGYDADAPVSPDEALDGFLRALSIPVEQIPPGVEAKAALYRTRLQQRRVLVILDNASTAEQVRPLLPGSPSCLVVVTSRSRLPSLTARNGARQVSLDPLSAVEAINLLRGVVGAGRVDAEPGAAVDLARHCGYLPLALRIAAERVAARAHVTLAGASSELACLQDRLDLLATIDNDETTAVRAVFSCASATPGSPARTSRRRTRPRGGRDGPAS